MDLKSKITKGVQAAPDFMIIYGIEGIGKTTFVSKMPKLLVADIEKGSKRVEVERYSEFNSLQDLWVFLNWFHQDKTHGYESLALDSLSEIERMIFKQTCVDVGVDNIEEVGGGFQKGYVYALDYWQDLLDALRRIQNDRGTHIALIGHAEVKKFTDPTTNSAYDRYRIKIDERAASLFRERLDFIGFANYNVYTKGKEKDAKHKAYGDSTRRFFTERRPSWDAKNRLGLPLEMAFSYEEYAKYAHASEASKSATLRENLAELLKDVKDEGLKKKVTETIVKAGDSSANLALIQDKLRTRLIKNEEGKENAATN